MACLATNAYSPTDSATGCGSNRPPLCEADLVAAARDGHCEAFEELCRRHAQQVFRIALRITGNHEDAEDALQESLLNAFVHIRDFDGRSRFSTWLTRIAINSALMLLRKNRNSPIVLEGRADDTNPADAWLQVADGAPDPEFHCLKNEQVSAVRAAVQSLRPTLRRAIELGLLQEQLVKETAEILGISVSAAKARTFHAKAALRKSWELQLLSPVGSRKPVPAVHATQRWSSE
jgi:RNA polymerase sigma factor (sigma-70 family)